MIQDQSISCHLLVTSDIHGHIHPTDYRSQAERPLGLAKLASLIKMERIADPALLLVDNGDLIQGTPLASYAVNQHREQLHPAVAVLNELRYDAAVIGNHEFNYGLPLLRQAISDSSFPWLSAGIVTEESGEPAFGKPYVVKQVHGVKIALLGVTTHYIPNWEAPEHIVGLKMKDALQTTKEWVRHIRAQEQPDLLVVSYHGGFERDLTTGQPVEKLTGENQAYAICTEVEGIDILLTGHQHRLLEAEVNGVAIVQPGCNGQALGKITIELAKRDGVWEVLSKRAELLMPDEHTPADAAILALSSALEAKTQQWLDQPIGQVIGDLSISSPHACRLAAHPFVTFMHRVQMAASGASISVAALLSEHSQGFHDTITMRDVLMNFIYPNTLAVLRITGSDIRAALEQTAAYFQIGADGDVVVNPAYLEPKAQHYNYDMWLGIEYELNVALPMGERVVKLERHGQSIDPNGEFEVVMSSYRAGGGGDYDMYRGKLVVQEIATDIAELAAQYIQAQDMIYASDERNWRIIAEYQSQVPNHAVLSE